MLFAGGKKENIESVEDENPYWISFSDLLAGILAIFALVLVVMFFELRKEIKMTERDAEELRVIKKNISELIKVLARIADIRKQMLDELKAGLRMEDIQVIISKNYEVLRIPADVLSFEPAKYDIPPEKKETVGRIGYHLKSVLKKYNSDKIVETIFIEGHTDSDKYEEHPLRNWGLSTSRAIRIWQHWTESPGNIKEFMAMENRGKEKLFSVSGYAESRRLVRPDLTDLDKERNRRIDIRFLMWTPMQKEMKEVLKVLERSK